MYRIKTLNAISKQGLSRLPDTCVVGNDVSEPDAILVRSTDMHKLEIPASLLAVGRAGAGTNNIPVKTLSGKGIVVFNTPGANANAVKELVLAGMLMGARNVAPALGFAASLQGDDECLGKQVEAEKKQFVGRELRGGTLGIIGLGAIGSLLAESALALGMKVIGIDPELTIDAAWRLPPQVRKAASVEDLLKHSDFVSLHVPLLPSTRNLIDAGRVKIMKSGCVLLNFAREGIVDTQAVIDSLDAGRLQAYLCDFPTNLLRPHPRAVTLPHLGASTREAEENCAIMAAEQLIDYLQNGNILNSVNFPGISMPRGSRYRLAIASANAPDISGQISAALAGAGLDISSMMNKLRGELAFTLVDTETEVPQAVIGQLAGVRGVLRVRYLPG
jgi:D-3-phosphoglycerate dehydrogenase